MEAPAIYVSCLRGVLIQTITRPVKCDVTIYLLTDQRDLLKSKYSVEIGKQNQTNTKQQTNKDTHTTTFYRNFKGLLWWNFGLLQSEKDLVYRLIKP